MNDSACVQIDYEAMQHNLRYCRLLAPNSQVMAVITNNAYGHGMLKTAEALSQANGFAVSRIQDAIELRHAGFIHPILVLHGFQSQSGLKAAAEHHLRMVIHDWSQLEILDSAPPSYKIDAALRLDVAHNQQGLPLKQAPSLHERLNKHPNIKPGCWLLANLTGTHQTQNPRPTTQLARFEQHTQGLTAPRSLASSAAIMRMPEAHANWIRPGLMLYGVSPFAAGEAIDHDLRATMTLSAPLIAIRTLYAGDSLGDNAGDDEKNVCTAETTVGIIACGYKQGYPHNAPHGTPVWLNGQKTVSLGRVSGDLLRIDLTNQVAAIGDRVELWGKHISVDSLATSTATCSTQLLCSAGNSCSHCQGMC